MESTITTVIFALIPIVAILALGKSIATANLLSAEGWIGLEKITYFVLFPALIVSKLWVADFSGLDWRMPVALVGAQVLLGALSIAIAMIAKQPMDRIGVFVQSAVRWNTFIALALAQEIIGPTGLALVAVAATAMIPTANVLSVVALMRYSNTDLKITQLIKQLAVNPLVLACAIGISLNLLGAPLLHSVSDILDLLGQATIAIGLLTTGAATQLKAASAPVHNLIGWSLLRLLGLPLIAGLAAIGLGVSGELLLVMLIATSVPTASNGTILARQLGADANLAANLIAFQTVLAIATISGILWFVSSALL